MTISEIYIGDSRQGHHGWIMQRMLCGR